MKLLRERLYQHCVEIANERIDTATQALHLAQEASVNDTKSSAGDKYETTREMMQQEISRNQAQLMEAKKLRHQLSQVPAEKKSDIIQNGSVVLTDKANFYLAISGGQMKLDENTYFVISPQSPIGRKLMGLKAGQSFSFNDTDYTIREVL